MARRFVEKIPREICDQSYIYISPICQIFNGEAGGPRAHFSTISYDPYKERFSPQPTVKLSLRRPCRQIHQDCKDIFWQLNTFSILQTLDLAFFTLWKSSGHHLHLAFDMSSAGKWAMAFKTFAYWSHKGSLKRLTLQNLRLKCFWKTSHTTSFKQTFEIVPELLQVSGRFCWPWDGLCDTCVEEDISCYWFWKKPTEDKQTWWKSTSDLSRKALWRSFTMCLAESCGWIRPWATKTMWMSRIFQMRWIWYLEVQRTQRCKDSKRISHLTATYNH